MMDDAGLYITVAQMQFFLNRKDGEKKFKASDAEFMMEDNPKCAKMYWDSDSASVSLSFPVKGFVAQALAEVASIFSGDDEEDYEDEDEDTFGIFK